MEFIKRMRKREFVEMALKTLSALLASFLAIILMEGMIYSIELNAMYNHSTVAIFYSDRTTAYCIEQDTDQYFVVCYDEEEKSWSGTGNTLYTKEECENFNAKNVVYHAPSAFIFSITPMHYVIMTIFVLVVAGFFTYRFIILKKDYDRIIKDYNETGTIEITNF